METGQKNVHIFSTSCLFWATSKTKAERDRVVLQGNNEEEKKQQNLPLIENLCHEDKTAKQITPFTTFVALCGKIPLIVCHVEVSVKAHFYMFFTTFFTFSTAPLDCKNKHKKTDTNLLNKKKKN